MAFSRIAVALLLFGCTSVATPPGFVRIRAGTLTMGAPPDAPAPRAPRAPRRGARAVGLEEPATDPLGASDGRYRVTRGGSFTNGRTGVSSARTAK